MTRNRFKQARFFKLWMDDPQSAVTELVGQISQEGLFTPEIIHCNPGVVLFNEKERNRYIFMVMEGEVELRKSVEGEGLVRVTSVRHGSMFGVMSFFSGHKALTTAVTVTPSQIWKLSKKNVELLLNSDLTVAGMGRQLLISNLMERYSQVVELNMQLHTVNRALEHERKHLDDTLNKLRNAHERLVHQEKMATLGQLVAGVAHEINNPVAALESANEYLLEMLPSLFDRPPGNDFELMRSFFVDGLNTGTASSIISREQIEAYREQVPELRTADIRRILQLSEASRKIALELYSKGKTDQLVVALKYAEAGMHMRRIKITSKRIASLVKSLKRYSRHESSGETECDLKEGIQDTLHILGNRLKNIELTVSIPDGLPKVRFDSGELNQVWTNLLVNACDALNDSGQIYIEAEETPKSVVVRIGDNGPGIPEDNWDKIFLPHFTTRNSSGNFGLGLGLSITRELVYRYHGDIIVGRSQHGGAEFKVKLKKAQSG